MGKPVEYPPAVEKGKKSYSIERVRAPLFFRYDSGENDSNELRLSANGQNIKSYYKFKKKYN